MTEGTTGWRGRGRSFLARPSPPTIAWHHLSFIAKLHSLDDKLPSSRRQERRGGVARVRRAHQWQPSGERRPALLHSPRRAPLGPT